VVSVAGMYRTGKSYLLNQVMLGRPDGFGVGPTVNPCTKGLWIWSRPLEGRTTEGEPCKVLVIDSEGIGAPNETTDHDTRVFTLAILLASTFVYNSVGSIDETALQSLSLMINLTKYIQVKSRGDTGSEELAPYFPSFLWIVRDFTLQLVDHEGETLMPKDYLERALAPSKGLSDSIEEKNRIRRLLKSFFSERDCVTMVRPTIQETDLQNLASSDLNDLRPEFSKQVKALRSRLLERAKPKSLNGKQLNGAMLADLVESYVGSINRRTIPSIENTWSYICQNECGKAVNEAVSHYERCLLELAGHCIPTTSSELKDFHYQAKTSALRHYNHKVGTMDSGSYAETLHNKIKERYLGFAAENETEGRDQAQNFLKDNYEVIDKRLKGGQLATLIEYEREVRVFLEFFYEHGPAACDHRSIALEFVAQKHIEAADFYLQKTSEDLNFKLQSQLDRSNFLEKDMAKLKEEAMRDKDNLLRSLTLAESERARLAALENSLRTQIESIKNDRDRVEKDIRESAANTREELQRELEETRKQLWDQEERTKALQDQVYGAEGQFKQDKALLEQKVHFLEASLKDMKDNEYTAAQELISYKKEQTASLKDLQSRFELQVKGLQTKVDHLNEANAELERSLAKKESQLDQAQAKSEEIMRAAKARQGDSEAMVQEVKARLTEQEAIFTTQIDALKRENDELKNFYRSTIGNSEQKWKETELHMKAELESLKRQTAILTQNNEFKDQQLAELQDQLEHERRQSEQSLLAFQSIKDENSAEALEIQLKQFKAVLTGEKRQLEAEFEEAKKDWNLKSEQWSLKQEELELKLKVESSEWEYRVKNMSDQLETVKAERQRLADQIKALRADNSNCLEESDAKTKQKVKILEAALEELQARASADEAQVCKRYEDSMTQLRVFYDTEKKRFEQRLSEERERSEKRYSQACEEYEAKLRDEQEIHEEEVNSLQEEMREIEASSASELNRLRHQASLDSQKVESLEKYIKEVQEHMSSIQAAHASSLEQQLDSFNKERALLLERIERMSGDVAIKERELATALNIKESLESQLMGKIGELGELKTIYAREKAGLLERLESTKSAYQQTVDDSSQKKSDFTRDLALANQQLEFQARKITDLESNLQTTLAKYNEVVKTAKNRPGYELNEQIDKLSAEKEALEAKLEEKRRSMKEVESSSSKAISILEKEKAVLSEKMTNLESRSKEYEERYKEEISSLKAQIKARAESESADAQNLQRELEKAKEAFQDLEKEHAEQTSVYERDKILWENKFNFLNQQRDSCNQKLQESQRKFETTIEQLKKRGNLDKDRLESATSSLLASVEARYSSQIRDLQETHATLLQAANEKVKVIERDYRLVREELELERRGRSCDSGSLEKRLQELNESEKRLLGEIELLKKEKERKLQECSDNFSKEKATLRSKLAEIEKRAKEAENQRGQLFLEHEKERAKWALERDHLVSQRNDAQDTASRLEKKRDALLRENEKMRADKGSRSRNLSRRDTPTGRPSSILGSSISFEDFNREKQNISIGTPGSSGSGTREVSPQPRVRHLTGVRAVSPLVRDKLMPRSDSRTRLPLRDSRQN